jgi:hypothetical protein
LRDVRLESRTTSSHIEEGMTTVAGVCSDVHDP